MLAHSHHARSFFYHRRVYARDSGYSLLAHSEGSDEEELARHVEEGGEEGEGVDCEKGSQWGSSGVREERTIWVVVHSPKDEGHVVGESEGERDLRKKASDRLVPSERAVQLTCTQVTTTNPTANSAVTGAWPVPQTKRKKRNRMGHVMANRERATMR